MDAQTVFSAIGTIGFPCVVCIYLLVRLEQNIKEMSQSINNLTISVDKLILINENKQQEGKKEDVQ